MAYTLSPEITRAMERLGIDAGLSKQILENYNAGKYDGVVPVRVSGIPTIDGKKIVDVTGDIARTYSLEDAENRIGGLDPEIRLNEIGRAGGGQIDFDADSLTELGVRLYPLLSYGILNGGSASSYVDYKKNQSFDPALFEICRKEFEVIERVSRGKAKGITPAFINPDGSPGPGFLELKMRSFLIEKLRYAVLAGENINALSPMFQMTSVFNNDEITGAYEMYSKGQMLSDLIAETGFEVTRVQTGIQPMLAALTHSQEGRPKGFFLNAGGKQGTPLAMPGGHGQNFIYLKEVYGNLFKSGKRFVCLGNVDNIGFTVNPLLLALLALEGNEAGFEFAFRTQVDIKGGVLVIDQEGRLNCADIGAAISKEEIKRVEKEGKKILFNVASGLFDLEFLTRNIDKIASGLPVRISDQDKDAGKYAQAEQVTWEVIAILSNPIIFGVDKYSRFLASKLLLEGLMASGVGLDNAGYPTDPDPERDMKGIAQRLSQGLTRQLAGAYGLRMSGGKWIPLPADEIREALKSDPLRAFASFR